MIIYLVNNYIDIVILSQAIVKRIILEKNLFNNQYLLSIPYKIFLGIISNLTL